MDYYFKPPEEQNQEYSDMAKGLNAAGFVALIVLVVAMLLPKFL